jgi:hypothetical protein
VLVLVLKTIALSVSLSITIPRELPPSRRACWDIPRVAPSFSMHPDDAIAPASSRIVIGSIPFSIRPSFPVNVSQWGRTPRG